MIEIKIKKTIHMNRTPKFGFLMNSSITFTQFLSYFILFYFIEQ
jgi:uncharacterized membrane protein